MDAGRRTFLKLLVILVNAITAAALATPVLGYILGPILKKRESRWVEIGPLDQFGGGSPKPARIKYVSDDTFREIEKAQSLWVLHEGEKPIVFSSVCTHLGCTVSWKEDRDIFFCPCHNAEFAKDGKVLAGPPPKPLTELPSKVEDGKIYVQV